MFGKLKKILLHIMAKRAVQIKFSEEVLNVIELRVDGKRSYPYFKGKKEVASYFSDLANFLLNAGYPNEAAKSFDTSLKIKFNDPTAIIYLQTLMYTSPEIYSNKRIYNITKQIMGKMAGSGVGEKTRKNFKNSKDIKRTLNIGYTCHFFDNSTATTLFLPLLKNHNRERVKVFIYSDQKVEITKESTKQLADVWHDTHGMSDKNFCELVIKDEIDVMLELNGFCVENRFKALNMRCAPAQVSFYNLSSTCGAKEVDYLLVGEEVNSKPLENFYSEKFFHKKGIQLATVIGEHFPEPAKDIPYKKNGYITFGSFGQIHKVSREQVFLWAEILKKLPTARFYFKANAFDMNDTLSAFKKHFDDAGIDLSRITFEGNSPYDVLLKCYEKVDIALDTFPYGGGTTTIEALIQGVPVIALNGERMCSQHGHINLFTANHAELICNSREEFVNKAVALANNIEVLENYRINLRDDVLKSERTNIKKYVSELEDAYFAMYKNFIDTNSKK